MGPGAEASAMGVRLGVSWGDLGEKLVISTGDRGLGL